jgi:hypothetical protein
MAYTTVRAAHTKYVGTYQPLFHIPVTYAAMPECRCMAREAIARAAATMPQREATSLTVRCQTTHLGLACLPRWSASRRRGRWGRRLSPPPRQLPHRDREQAPSYPY